MIQAGFGVSAVALATTIAIASARGEPTTSPQPTVWDHNGSVMYLVAKGSTREIYYQKPRPGMVEAGAHAGSLLFRGEVSNGQYLGTAYIFNVHCGPMSFEAKGTVLADDERIVLTGQAPRVGQHCRTFGSHTSNLEFRRLKPDETVQSKPAAAALQPAIVVSKLEVSSSNAGEVSSAPTGQPSAKNKTLLPTKDSSAGVADSTTATASTNGISEAKDPYKYLWVAAFIVMTVWLLIVAFGKILVRL